MGEDPRPRRRLVARGYGPLTGDAVTTFFRGVWKLALVLVLTLAILSAIGWAIEAISDDDGSDAEIATTVDEP
jgi:hypothetical protein